jgi:hypothetical protein
LALAVPEEFEMSEMTPDEAQAYIDQVCEEDDRLRAERACKAERRAAEAPPVRKPNRDEVLHREHEIAHWRPPPRAASGGFRISRENLVETLGEVISDERWREREELQGALAPLQREIAAMRTELAELRGFRDGLVGRDVPTAWFKLRGEYREGHVYGRLDIVSRDGAWWIARCDDPGPIGGDGWREGPRAKQGEKGARGPRGLQGAPGRDAPKFVGWDIDRANYRVVAKMSDGSEMVLELRPLFEQYDAEKARST